ncbi:hypothetical protein BDR05DRAFT_288807 [Suillus weaverae]|nr:hypothetical protein BDR05DRAFT_288807 [Suillus weaverae]
MCHIVSINIEVHLYVKSCLYHVRTYMLQLAAIAPFLWCLSPLVGLRHRKQTKSTSTPPLRPVWQLSRGSSSGPNQCPLFLSIIFSTQRKTKKLRTVAMVSGQSRNMWYYPKRGPFMRITGFIISSFGDKQASFPLNSFHTSRSRAYSIS